MSEIRTAAERAALPAGTVVLSSGGTIACRHVDLDGVLFGIAASFPWDRLQLPLTVLYHPDQPQRVQPSREDVRAILARSDPETGLIGYLGSERYQNKCLRQADAVLALFAAQPTVAQVKAEALREAADAVVPGRWWRVVAPDGSIWCESSDEQENRRAARPGDRVERLYVAERTEWREEARR